MPELQPKPHILVVDDDTRLRDLLKSFLREHGFAVTTAKHAAEARKMLGLFAFDLMVLDVMMPGETGIEFARTLNGSAPPVLLLTAMSEASDRISGFEAGVDDYLVKPFEPRELVLRIQAILRRTGSEGRRGPVAFGEYRFDPETGRLLKGDAAVALTTGERELLRALAARAGEPVSRAALAGALGAGASERSVDVQVTRLRRKIEADSTAPLYLQTVRGAGYVLQGDS